MFIQAWTSVVLLSNFIYPSSATTFAYFLCIPIIVISSYAILEYRRLYFLHCNIADFRNPYEVECIFLLSIYLYFIVKARFILQPITDYMIEKKIDYGHYMMKDDYVKSGYLFESLPSALNQTNDLQLLTKKLHEKILGF